MPDLSPTPPWKTKIGHSSLRKSVISPRKSEEVSDQSKTQSGLSQTGWVLTVESYHNRGLIAS